MLKWCRGVKALIRSITTTKFAHTYSFVRLLLHQAPSVVMRCIILKYNCTDTQSHISIILRCLFLHHVWNWIAILYLFLFSCSYTFRWFFCRCGFFCSSLLHWSGWHGIKDVFASRVQMCINFVIVASLDEFIVRKNQRANTTCEDFFQVFFLFYTK